MVIAEARQRLSELETRALHTTNTVNDSCSSTELNPDHDLVNKIKKLDPDSLSPREALELLYQLKHTL